MYICVLEIIHMYVAEMAEKTHLKPKDHLSFP